MSVLTLRLIKNFEYRTISLFVLKDIDLENTTSKELLKIINESTFYNKSRDSNRRKTKSS
jgi:hypothetical protein